ncbi:MAG: hypothetical protein CMB32_01010 [Euryarchaeota archaeon]|nr:hypothetical protein [Euryarchaeota archaeon]|tara:strand:- start:816 stop:1094 length:279 start_codon:yes stop_codon:yes gene_type:complete
MSIPLNTLRPNSISINNLVEARLWIDSFPRPLGFSPYAWSSTKRIALEVWKSFFTGQKFNRTLNFMHPTFYSMIRTPEGFPILKEKSIRGLC